MLQVFHLTLIKDEDFIQIHHQKIIFERMQDIVHHPLEICWGILQAKGHDQPFKNTFFGLPYIALLYWDLVVARIYINLTEVSSPLEMVKEITNS
jgi:hypothetical protein